MEQKKLLQQWNRLLVPGVFLLILAGGGLWQHLMPDRAYSPSERRALAQKPEFSAENVLDASYMADFETYLTDQFPMRDGWITAKTYAGLLLGQRETGGVYITKDHSLIELHRESDLEKERILQNTETLLSFTEDMTERFGAEHVRLMLVPTAECIWEDKLPDDIALFDQSAYLDLLQQTLEQTDEDYAQILVPVEAELALHAQESIYYKTDHHWTALGAYYGYAAYAGETTHPLSEFEFVTVTDQFTGTTAAKCGLYDVTDRIELIYPQNGETYIVDHNLGEHYSDSLYEEALAKGDDPYAVYLGGNDAIVTILKNTEGMQAEHGTQTESSVQTENGMQENASGRSLLIIRDSYANCFVPYLTGAYEKITMVDLRYYNGSIRDLTQEGYTDVLILYNLPNFLSDRQIYKLTR